MNDLPLLSTTSTLSRIRGFTLELLFLLKDECLTSTDISQRTGKSGNYVRSYLYNMQKYGLVDKELSFWKITILGRKIIEHYIKVNNIIIESKRRAKDGFVRMKICYAPTFPLRRVGAKQGKFKLNSSLETATLMT